MPRLCAATHDRGGLGLFSEREYPTSNIHRLPPFSRNASAQPAGTVSPWRKDCGCFAVRRGERMKRSWLKPRHRGAARTLGLALTLGNQAQYWHWTAGIWQARLSRAECSNVLAAAIAAAHPKDAVQLMEEGLTYFSAGAPIPPLFSFEDEAKDWAGLACNPERLAYTAAGFTHLPVGKQRAFVEAISRRIAA